MNLTDFELGFLIGLCLVVKNNNSVPKEQRELATIIQDKLEKYSISRKNN